MLTGLPSGEKVTLTIVEELLSLEDHLVSDTFWVALILGFFVSPSQREGDVRAGSIRHL